MWPGVDASFIKIIALGKCLLTPTLIPFHRSSGEIAEPGPISSFTMDVLRGGSHLLVSLSQEEFEYLALVLVSSLASSCCPM